MDQNTHQTPEQKFAGIPATDDLSRKLSGGQYPPPLPAHTPTENSGLAITSMVLGISGFLLCGVTSLPAVICGHLAYRKIKRSQGRISGGGFAIAGLITGYLVLSIILPALLTMPMVTSQRKKADQTEAMSNARQLGLALNEFDLNYGSLPNAATAILVAEDVGTTVITGSSSNSRFRQLFQAGITQSEYLFYVKAPGIHQPDGFFDGDRALGPGECGFGYIEGSRSGTGKPRPVAMTPFKTGRHEFDPEPFDGEAVILWSDGSVITTPIERATGKVILGGQNLLDPSHPVWGGTPYSLLLPE